MRYFKEIFRKNRAWIVLFIALGLCTAFLESFRADQYQRVLDGLLAGPEVLAALAVYGGVYVLLVLLNYLMNLPEQRLEHGVYLDFKQMALRKLKTVDFRTYRAFGTGKMTQRIESGSMAGKSVLLDFWLRLFSELVPAVAFSVAFIARISLPVTLALLAGYVFVFLVTNLLLRRLYDVKERILTNEESLNHVFVRGFLELITFRIERRFSAELKKAEEAAREIVGSKTKMRLIHEAFFTVFALLVAALDIGILLYAHFTRALTVGEVVALIALADRAYQPIAIFNVLFVQYKLEKASFKRLTDFLDAPEDPRLTCGEPLQDPGDIEVQGVSYGYGARRVLDNISLRIRRGEHVAFVGESGSGKTTLLHLLAGLLKYEEGAVKLGGQPLRDIALESLYARTRYLPQEAPVFDGTLRENLAFDAPIPDSELIAALENARLGALFRSLPDGLETALGEHGAQLSGGERQRAALARVWLEKRPLVFLDEATSAVDNLTEEALLAGLLRETADCTVISVMHRLNCVRLFDRIVVFREGKIAADGSYGDLMRDCPYFRELVEEQTV